MIYGVNELPSQLGHRWFELYGAFPAADNQLRRYRAQSWANNTWLDTRVDFESPGQINVEVPMVAAGAGCMFRVGLSDGPWSRLFGPVFSREAMLEIRGFRNVGRNVAGRWDVELYGRFGADPRSVTVTCDGHPVFARPSHQSPNQVNVEFALPMAGACCSFEVNREDKQHSTRFSQVLGREPVRMSPALAAYFWGGMVPMEPSQHEALTEGLSRLAQAGFQAARIRLTPELLRSELNVYNFDLDAWNVELANPGSFLAVAAKSSYYQRAFNTPGLQTFVLTVYDAASMGRKGTEDNFYRPAWLAVPANAAAVRNEYRELTLVLCETQRGTGKRFIITNWETDNHLYVDGVSLYASKIRASLTPTPSSPPPTERVAGFIRWFQLRKEGIAQGNEEAQGRGWTGVRVDDAVEFAAYLLPQRVGAPSTLFDIIPAVNPTVASYSSWDTGNAGRLDEDLAALQRQLGPGTELILGEFGYEFMAGDGTAGWRFIEAVKAAKRAHISVITVWEAFTTIDRKDGLLDFDGNEREILRRLREVDTRPVLDMSGPIAILGIRDCGDVPGEGRRYFELYGRFPAPATQTYRVEVVSDGVPIAANVTFPGQSQINAAIQMRADKHWCVFRVHRSDQASSNEYGPCLVSPMERVP
jgi:hypothetical protein